MQFENISEKKNMQKHTFEFKLPKILHDSDLFVQDIILQSDEKWYGINKTIYCNKSSDAKKINNILTIEVCLNGESVSRILSIRDVPHTDYYAEFGFPLDNANQSYYCLKIDDYSASKYQQRYGIYPTDNEFIAKTGDKIEIKLIFHLVVGKKYIKLSNESIININVLYKTDVDKK